MKINSGQNRPGRWLSLTGALLLAISAAPLPSVWAADHEQGTVLPAAEILPADVISGAHHKIADQVRADGVMYFFQIQSEFGEFDAYGSLALQVRLGEIAALGELSEVSKVGVFAGSAVQSVLRPVGAVVDFVDKPVETIKGIPQGVGRMFGRLKAKVEDAKEERAASKEEKALQEAEGGAASEDEDGSIDKAGDAVSGYASDALGYSAAQRKWAAKLGVDPYTSNETLRKAIGAVAKVDAAGSVGVKLVGIPKIPGVDYIQDVNQLVWSKDPAELEALNGEHMAAMGLSRAEMERLRGNVYFASPSRRTRLISALAAIEGVAGRDAVVRLAAESESDEEALFQMVTAMLLQLFHQQQTALVRIVPSESVGFGLTEDDRFIVAVPTDYLMWAEEIETAFVWLGQLAESAGAKKSEIWTPGRLSERCLEEVEALGWEVHAELKLK